MALSDTLFQAQYDIQDYCDYDDTYDSLKPRIDEILCKMIAIRIELDCFDHKTLKDNAFYKAVLDGNYKKYRELDEEDKRVHTAARMGLRETFQMQRLKFFTKLNWIQRLKSFAGLR